MGKYQAVKQLVLEYIKALEKCETDETLDVLRKYTADDYNWKGVYPFREQQGAEAVAENFWIPLKRSLQKMQRRMDIFIAGNNMYCPEEQWVMNSGNFMGLFDEDWLGIRRTRKMNCLRYAEFHCVKDGRITKTGLFVDILGFTAQAGVYPLPPSTGAYFVYPGPRGHNGLLFEDAPEEEGVSMLALLNKMVDDLHRIDKEKTFDNQAIIENYALNWAEDMIWYGPCGIGATYTIPRYAEQHQGPFSRYLADNTFNGHLCRFAEGDFACFFGWPNLTNTPTGGFMGLPGGNIPSDMQVVDLYCRTDGKLSENWVYIDLLWWLKQQGLDVLERTQQILNP